MPKTVKQTKTKQKPAQKAENHVIAKPTQGVSSKSIVLEQNGEKKILKKIKIKGPPPKNIPKLTQSQPREGKDDTSDKRTFTCTFCKSTFDNQPALKEHFVKHATRSDSEKNPPPPASGDNSGEKGPRIVLIECEWCPETFTRMSKAIEHKYRKHNYESKNYFCTLCGKLFPLKVALEQHEKMEHKNDKETSVRKPNTKIPRLDFICGFCGTAFSCQDALEMHIKTAHNLEKRMMAHPYVPKPSKKVRLNQAGEIISIYYCYLCGSEYMLKFNLLKHIEDHHPYEDRCAMPEDMLKCSTCDSMFYTKKAFDTHNVHHKPEDLYVTSEEHRLNIVARVDQDFDYQRVPTALDKALGSIATGSDSAAALAKKHGKKDRRSKNSVSSTTTSSSNSGSSETKEAPVVVGLPIPLVKSEVDALKTILQ